jgi:LacI family transcriptional regulator
MQAFAHSTVVTVRMSTNRRATLADVARIAGVSPATVSRALKQDHRISAITRDVVVRAAEQLSYVPNQAARSLVMRSTRTLGLLVPDVTDPMHGQVIAAFEQEATARGYSVSIGSVQSDAARERRSLELLAAQRADGVALMGSVLRQRDVVEALHPTPAVFIKSEHLSLASSAADLPNGCIRADETRGIEALVQHLVEQGCRRLAYLNGPPIASNAVRRLVASRAVHAASHTSDVVARLRQYSSGVDGWRSGKELVSNIVQDRARPDAVICFDDKLALAVMDALRAVNLRVPDELAVVGFDDIPFAGLANPRLTTVAQPSAEMGRLAAAMLLDADKNGEVPRSVKLPVELVVRESSLRSRAVQARVA